MYAHLFTTNFFLQKCTISIGFKIYNSQEIFLSPNVWITLHSKHLANLFLSKTHNFELLPVGILLDYTNPWFRINIMTGACFYGQMFLLFWRNLIDFYNVLILMNVINVKYAWMFLLLWRMLWFLLIFNNLFLHFLWWLNWHVILHFFMSQQIHYHYINIIKGLTSTITGNQGLFWPYFRIQI